MAYAAILAMNKFRSIDVGWEYDDIIYDDSPGGEKRHGVYKVYFDGNRHKLMSRKYAPFYFQSIGYTGTVYFSYPEVFPEGINEYKYLNGDLHCEDGPAVIMRNRFCAAGIHFHFYKWGKPWLCLKDESGKRFPFNLFYKTQTIYFNGKKFEYEDDYAEQLSFD
jgi:hypothetical protein